MDLKQLCDTIMLIWKKISEKCYTLFNLAHNALLKGKGGIPNRRVYYISKYTQSEEKKVLIFAVTDQLWYILGIKTGKLQLL